MLQSFVRNSRPVISRYLNTSTSYAVKTGIEKYRSRLLYQSLKRGILENDIIIGGFARQYLPVMNEKELEAYEKIINGEYMEWDLFYYVSDRKPPPPELDNCKVFNMMKDFVKNKETFANV
uniref:SDH assembly factor 2 n=1 Tax=Panagrolaimus sp. PS1159 TaxID=55785 RepID=A0AC35FGN1_9BILA